MSYPKEIQWMQTDIVQVLNVKVHSLNKFILVDVKVFDDNRIDRLIDGNKVYHTTLYP